MLANIPSMSTASGIVRLQGRTASSGHPSPTDSDPKASSDSTGLPDTHSESSEVSPASPQSDRATSNGSDCQQRDGPQDLSMKKATTQKDVSFENGSDPLALKCSECGSLFASESLLKMHIQETHGAGAQESSLSAYQQYANAAGLQYDSGVFRDSRQEQEAIASLLSLQQLQGQMAADSTTGAMEPMSRSTVIQNGTSFNGSLSAGEKIFNREAYCEICNKEFCNKYYLQTHKATKHNVPAVPGSGGKSRSSLGSYEDIEAQLSASVPQEIAAPKAQHANMTSHDTESSSAVSAELRCPFCGQECANQYQLQSHVITLHSGQSQTASLLGSHQAQAAAIQALYAAQLMGAGNPFAANPFSSMNLEKMRALMGAGLMPPMTTNSPASTPTQGIIMTGANPLDAYIQGQNVAAAAATAGFGLGSAFPTELGSLTSGLPVVTSAGMGFGSVTGTPEGTPVGHSISSTSSFNREAYCELCRKEFCNKYFLRTHKQKKHGIQSEDSPTHYDQGFSRKRPYGSMTLNTSQDGSLPTMVSLNGLGSFTNNVTTTESSLQPPEPKRSPLSEALQKPPVTLPIFSLGTERTTNGAMKIEEGTNGLSAGPISDGQITPRSDGGADNVKLEDGIYTSEGLSLNKLLASSQENPPREKNVVAPPQQLQTTNQPMFCNICSRSFTSVFGLVAHKYRDHAGAGLDTTPLPASFGTGGGIKLQSTPSKENEPPMLQAVDPEAYCELCQKEFCSKYFLKTHRMNIHGIADSLDSTPTNGLNGALSAPSAGGVASSPSKVSATINAVLQSTLGNGASSPINNSTSSPNMLDRRGSTPSSLNSGGGQRPRYVTGKNFCDICNKEVCNKYFLRTHMLKMHGIVIDENKTVIGNINTVDKEKLGNLVFRCDTCNKELSSRHFLRIHKMNVHGVSDYGSSPGPTPKGSDFSGALGSVSSAPPNVTVSSNGGPPNYNMPESPDKGVDPGDFGGISNVESYTEVCGMCDRRFKSLKWLKNHIFTEHCMGLGESKSGSNGESSQASPMSGLRRKSESTDVDVVEGENEPKLNLMSKCEYCPLAFKDVIQLQLHIIGQHAIEVQGRTRSLAEHMALSSFALLKPPAAPGPNETVTPKKVEQLSKDKEEVKQSPPMVLKHNGTKLYRCSYCHYYTKWLSNLSVHERRHTGDAPKEEKPFVCNICLRAYRYAHSLERHREVHKYSSNASMQFFNGLKSPEKMDNAGLKESSESETTGAPIGYGQASQKQATGAKRFRCTKCQKIFKSRELCRSHLYAVHRREEVYRPEAGPISPSKSYEPLLKGQESPNSVKAAIRSLMNDITKEVSKGASDTEEDPISQVVEQLHTEQNGGSALFPANNETTTEANSATEHISQPKAFALPSTFSAKQGQPYMIQEFKMILKGIEGQNGGRPAFFDDMTVYLPVYKRVHHAVDIYKVSLEPAKNSEKIISV